jgi:multidrug efflux pump subunit AcrB
VIAALLPMAFVSGLMGPYMSPIPINASMGMLLSLAIAFVVTPWLARLWMPARRTRAPTPRRTAWQRRLAPLFTRVLRRCSTHAARRAQAGKLLARRWWRG